MALQTEPDLLLAPLVARMARLAAQERFEEAAELRDRGALLERTVHRHLETQALLDASEIVVSSGGRAFLLRGGRLAGAVDARDKPPGEVLASLLQRAIPGTGPADDAAGAQREAAIITAWLKRTTDARLLHAQGPWAHPARARPRAMFRPVDP